MWVCIHCERVVLSIFCLNISVLRMCTSLPWHISVTYCTHEVNCIHSWVLFFREFQFFQVILRKHQALWYGVWHYTIPYLIGEQESIYSKIVINCQHICCYCPESHIKVSCFPDIFLFSNIHCTLIWHITNQAGFYNLATPISAGVVTEREHFQDGGEGLPGIHFEPVICSQHPSRQFWGISHEANQ